MSTLNARFEFAPPPPPGMLRAFSLAIAAHVLLLAFLAMGVQWKNQPTPVTVEAELWSSVPHEAAAPPPEPEPEPAPEPAPVQPRPAPPKPVPVVQPPVPVEPTPDPAIAIAKEKARLKKEKLALKERQDLEEQRLAQLEQEKRDKEALKNKKLQAEKEVRKKEAHEKEQLEKIAREKLEHDKLAQKKLKDEAAAKQAAKDAAKEAAQSKKLAELRQENMKRLTGLAAGTGETGSRGTATQSSGPSAGYAGKIRARIKPNITYTESITGNPAAEVEVRTTSGGTIISRKLTQSSGIKSWDEAVLNAIDKTETLPADTDGKVPSQLLLVFRPKD